MAPSALILGSTGKIGGEVLRLLIEKDKQSDGDDDLNIIATVRSKEKVGPAEENLGVSARVLDLDDEATFAPALQGVNRAFLMTGYSVDMMKQSKGFLDAAKEAGVRHIVHLGASGSPSNQVAHWGWHKFVEAYIEKLGFTWTHLRPEAFMQNITGPGFRWLSGDKITHFTGDAKWGWVDCYDVAAVAAEAIMHPDKHSSKVVPLSYDAKTLKEVTQVLSEVSGRTITEESRHPDEFLESALKAGGDPAYMNCLHKQFSLDSAGKSPGICEVYDNFEGIVGRAPATWGTFAAREKELI